ncbi:DUF2239 family protein [soil metagenome]
MDKQDTYIAFLEGRRLSAGALHEVAVAVRHAQKTHPGANVLVFSDRTGHSADLDLRGREKDIIARYTVDPPVEVPKGRGRPKLGVVAREVTLLPEHWDWLAAQSGGASVALRKLVHEARRSGVERDRIRQARDRAYHAMSTLAGDQAGFEEASRSLFAGDQKRMLSHMVTWPDDVKSYVVHLAQVVPD